MAEVRTEVVLIFNRYTRYRFWKVYGWQVLFAALLAILGVATGFFVAFATRI